MPKPRSSTAQIATRGLRLLLALLLALSVTIGLDFSLEARQAIFGQRQIQLYVPYTGASPVYLQPVLLVAHNAGDQKSTSRAALRHNATAIEIDVSQVDGVLYASHSRPSELMPIRAWRAPKLRDAWNYTGDASVLKLDLKSTGQSTLESIVRFIESRPGERQIMFVSMSAEALAYLDSALPDAVTMLSLPSGREIDALLVQDGRVDGVEGVSVPEWSLTPERIEGLKAHGYLIDAWTVNDVERLIELTAMGVDSITTDNLAFFDLAIATMDSTPRSGI